MCPYLLSMLLAHDCVSEVPKIRKATAPTKYTIAVSQKTMNHPVTPEKLASRSPVIAGPMKPFQITY